MTYSDRWMLAIFALQILLLGAGLGVWWHHFESDRRWHGCIAACGALPVDDASADGCICRGSVWRPR